MRETLEIIERLLGDGHMWASLHRSFNKIRGAKGGPAWETVRNRVSVELLRTALDGD